MFIKVLSAMLMLNMSMALFSQKLLRSVKETSRHKRTIYICDMKTGKPVPKAKLEWLHTNKIQSEKPWSTGSGLDDVFGQSKYVKTITADAIGKVALDESVFMPGMVFRASKGTKVGYLLAPMIMSKGPVYLHIMENKPFVLKVIDPKGSPCGGIPLHFGVRIRPRNTQNLNCAIEFNELLITDGKTGGVELLPFDFLKYTIDGAKDINYEFCITTAGPVRRLGELRLSLAGLEDKVYILKMPETGKVELHFKENGKPVSDESMGFFITPRGRERDGIFVIADHQFMCVTGLSKIFRKAIGGKVVFSGVGFGADFDVHYIRDADWGHLSFLAKSFLCHLKGPSHEEKKIVREIVVPGLLPPLVRLKLRDPHQMLIKK